MSRDSRFVAALGCAAAIATAGCAANIGPAPANGVSQQPASKAAFGPGWIAKDGVVYHVPHYLPSRRAATLQPHNPYFQVAYNGGPVLVAPKLYLILWGYQKVGDPDQVAELLKSYLKNVGGSAHDNIYTQYYMTSGSSTTYVTNPANQFGGIWDDETNPLPRHPSDARIAAEALNGVAQFGYDPNGSYVVATPHWHSTPGFGNFCAYHGSTLYNGQNVSYTNMPYAPDAGADCGANIIKAPGDERGVDEGVTILLGHEFGESITDPVPNTGWVTYDPYNGGGEIGDFCIWMDIANDPFNKKSFTMQPMFSNATSTCVQSY